MVFTPSAEWFGMDEWFREINGMQMDAMSFKLEVGEYPKVEVNLSVKRFVEEMTREELKRLIKYCEERLKCPT